MIHLYGIALQDEEAARLIALLMADGAPESIDAASSIEDAIRTGRSLVRVTPAMRASFSRVLVDLPDALVELRERLERTTLVGREW